MSPGKYSLKWQLKFLYIWKAVSRPWSSLNLLGLFLFALSKGGGPGLHKTGIRGNQDTRQIGDGKTNDKENNNKKGAARGPDFLA